MRFRRLRNGALALSRLRPDPPARPGLAHDCDVDDCVMQGAPHRHLGLSAPLTLVDTRPPVPVGRPVDAAHPPTEYESTRPHPAANAWPDDAVTLTYGELRRLVALHLELCASAMPGVTPWEWIKERRRQVLEGEAPLLVSEVMEP